VRPASDGRLLALASLGAKGPLQEAVVLGVLESDILAMEAGLETVVGPRGVRLSGGQRQRTAAARMYVRDAEILIFDDLSSALDVETEKKLWSRLFTQRDVTCLVVSHRQAPYGTQIKL
jgi:ATP-binding cassette, subfamily B, bacterial